MSYIYAIHDPWFHGFRDGDVDDRAAFCVYERFLESNTSKKIIVYVGERYEETINHYRHFHIEFQNTLIIKDIEEAEKVIVCAPINDPFKRAYIASILSKKKNGYCQGCTIGCMNFPNSNYENLLKSMKVKYSTADTMITFPNEFIQKLDPIYYSDYQEYGYIKLFSPGAIVSIPGLLYRLYCPEMGGGPGTNMLMIQRCLQKHFYLVVDIPVNKDNFSIFNERIILENKLTPTRVVRELTDNYYLQCSLTVMMYFANLVYKTEGLLYKEDTELYSLDNLPPGRIEITEEETPPLYDLVVAHAVVYNTELPQKELLLDVY